MCNVYFMSMTRESKLSPVECTVLIFYRWINTNLVSKLGCKQKY